MEELELPQPRPACLILTDSGAPRLEPSIYPTGRRRDGHGLLAVEGHSRSLRQHPRAPHAYFAAPVFRGRRAVKYMYSDVGIHQNSEEEERTDGELN